MELVWTLRSYVDRGSENQVPNANSRRVQIARSHKMVRDRIRQSAGVHVDSRTGDHIRMGRIGIGMWTSECCGRWMVVTVRMDGVGILGREAGFDRPCRVVAVEVFVSFSWRFLYVNCLLNAILLIASPSAMLELEVVLQNNKSSPNTLPLHIDFCRIIPPTHQTRRP